MQISDNGLALIKRHEGKILTAYKCPAGVWTIGYGHTHQVKSGDVIDDAMATEFLKKDVRHAQAAIARYVKVELDQNQFDALVSFIYNVGAGAFGKSTLLRRLNESRYAAAADQFRRWNKGGGRVLRGLVRRRADEAELFANIEVDGGMAQIVDAPAVKTKLTSKTNWAAGIGSIGAIVSQTDVIGKAIDKVNDVTQKGGDLAAKMGGVADVGIVPLIAVVALVGLFVFIMHERNKKVDEHGL